ncbi:porin [Massilia sp. W12]|uniref:porin n=1 Tax=Massilia sp. W12 TaxID=3126507 RepID=UPI0030CD1E11
MKMKTVTALIAACCASTAFAQSSVTMYGLADAGFNISSLGGNDPKVKIASGIAEGSRLGFKGVEDIGGGYKAIFTLEARVELDTGNNSVGNLSTNTGYGLTRGMEALPAAVLNGVRTALNPAVVVNSNRALFDRTSMVGLITPVGAILMGRQYTPAYEVFAAADTFEVGTAGSWGWVNGGIGGLLTTGSAIRSDKSIQYRIADPKSGFGAAVMYGLDKSGYIGLDKRFWSFNVTYKANGWDVGIGHNYGTDQVGNRGLVTTTLGGSYKTGDWKLFAGYQRMKNENSVLIPVFIGQWDATIAPSLAPLGAATAGALRNVFVTNLKKNFYLDSDSYSLGFHYHIGAGRIMASYSHQNDKSSYDADTTLYAVGYDHFLSKRTDLYAVFGYQKNRNLGQYAPGIAATAGGFTGAPGESAKVLQLGMRHKF